MDVSAVISIIVFAFVIILILLGFKKRKSQKSNRYIKLDYGTAPLIGVIILLLTFTINFDTIIKGIIGTERISPYSIIILFMSLAYICISIDLTGFFEFLALKVLKAGGNSGRRIFVYFFFFSSILTIFTSNDIVILTITPIIIYLAKYAKINPFPYLIGQFFAANIWSITLYIGNPTNIIVAEAYDLTFLEYSRWTLLPTVLSGFTCLILLFIVLKSSIPKEIETPQIEPSSAIKDKYGAIFGMCCLITCLIMLSIAPFFNFSLWQITLTFAIILVIYNILHDMIIRNEKNKTAHKILKDSGQRMPWKIIPFVIGMFILVEALLITGWVDLIAITISNISKEPVSSIFSMTFITSFTANLMNNQPMTILFTQVLLSNSLQTTEIVKFGMMFALIMGSNFGANFTLIGALAGIMWQKIAADNEIQISFKNFAKFGFIIMPLVIIVACSLLAVEIIFWF